ncbi:MAG: SpoIIE family protein phosphatase [Vicinamibacterales bacterium]|nr:SpoIIE family protein phosphatase [Vicinamibacterales bacterium]
MAEPRLDVHDGMGRRMVVIDRPVVAIGRRTESDLRLVGSDVSRDHAEIARVDGHYVLRDRGSRYGTLVNDETVTEHRLAHGDRIQFGRTGAVEAIFLADDGPVATERHTNSAVGDLRQLAALLEGLRALGSGRVLDEVLALVLDAAIEITGAERGFIMLASPAGALEMKLARARGHITLPGTRFDTSRKIPEEVFSTGELKVVADLLDGDLANVHMGTVALGIRHVLCTPLRLVRYVDRPDIASEPKTTGVLYLDSREKGQLLSASTRTALDTLATEAGVAIENARLYRETLEKARIEHELNIAAEIQQALLPPGRHDGAFYQAIGASLPSRSIGGDFYDVTEIDDGSIEVVVGDVSGKGPAAALLTAKIQGLLAAYVGDAPPAETLHRVNQSLLRRAIGARYATMFLATITAAGELTYCNAGHNPPVVYGGGTVRRLTSGGMPVGFFKDAPYTDARVQLSPGDVVVIYSDGVTEALNTEEEEFGEERLVALLEAHPDASAADILARLIDAVQAFAAGAPQHDDVTALVVKYTA